MAHDFETVIAALEEAFADNDSEATCVDAGTENDVRYATVVVVFAPVSVVPEQVAAVTSTGRPTLRKRTKADRNALYTAALGSTVLATVKEGFAVAPSIEEIRVLVLRKDPQAATPAQYVTAVYAARFGRARTEQLPWETIDPAEVLLRADEAVFKRKGAAGDVVPIDLSQEPALEGLVDALRPALMQG